jgi:hypothetical protein
LVGTSDEKKVGWLGYKMAVWLVVEMVGMMVVVKVELKAGL